MATTFYSTPHENLRCRCDYNVASTNTVTTVSGTIYLQHKGAANNFIVSLCAGINWSDTIPQDYDLSDIETDSVTSVSKHTDWTNLKSKAFSYSFNREHSSHTVYLYIGTGVLGNDGMAYKGITIPAKPSYAVTYNANGGGAMPPNGTKYYDETYYISSTTPTRSGYKFKSWNTSAGGSGTSYNPSQSYATNAALALYAQWYAVPAISSLTVVRCNAQGQEDTNGNCALVTCVWSIETDTATITGKITPQEGTATTFTFSSGSTGTSGTAIAIISSSNGQAIDTDMQYVVEITARNNAYSSAYATLNEMLTRAYFVMDFKAGGSGVGIGRAAPNEGLEVGYVASFDDDTKFFGRMLMDISNYQSAGSIDKKLYDAIDERFMGDVLVRE